MNFGSLFTGIGGIDLGLERAGMTCTWQVELDPFCNRVLEKHWPKVPRFLDVKEVGSRELKSVQVIAGGFPCQDLSSAGRQRGISAERSGLWFEFRRVLAALLPDWAIVENVFQPWRNYVPIVRRELWGLGYSSLPIRLRAVDFGALHLRARCFVVAHANSNLLRPELWGLGCRARTSRARDDGSTRSLAYPDGEGQLQQEGSLFTQRGRSGDCGETLADSSCQREREPADEADAITGRRTTRKIAGSRSESMADADGLGRDGRLLPAGQAASQSSGLSDLEGGHPWALEPDVGRVAHGVPNRAHRLRGLGNAVVPQKAEWIGRRIMSFHAKRTGSEEV